MFLTIIVCVNFKVRWVKELFYVIGFVGVNFEARPVGVTSAELRFVNGISNVCGNANLNRI